MSEPIPSEHQWIEAVTVRHFAGVRPENSFTLSGFSPGINLIHGKNGCGKTTTAHAMQSLVWPSPEKGTYRSLEAVLHQQQREWQIEINGPTIQQTPLGEGFTVPEAPPSELRSRYQWSLRNLLQQDDHHLAGRIAAEMAGGIDFTHLATQLKCDSPPSAPRKHYDQWKQANRRVIEARQAQKNLQDRVAACEDLKEKLVQYEQQAQQATRIQQALDILNLRNQHAELSEKLSTYPTEMSEIHSRDADRIQSLKKEADETQKKLTELQLGLKSLGKGETDWQTVATSDIREAIAKLDQEKHLWSEAQDERNEAEKILSEKEIQEREYRRRLHVERDELPQWEESYQIPEIRSWIQVVFRAEAALAEVEKLEEALTEPETDLPELDSLLGARQALESWLSAGELMRDPHRWIGFGFTWTLLTGFVLYGIRNQSIPPFFGLFILFPLLVEGLSRKSGGAQQRKTISQSFPSDLPQPPEWDEDGVRTALTKIESEIEAVHAHALWEEDRKRLDTAKRKADEALQERDRVTFDIFGEFTESSVYPEWAAHFLEDVQQWRTFRTEVALAEFSLNEKANALEHAETRLQETMTPWKPQSESDTPDVQSSQLKVRMSEEIRRRDEEEKIRIQETHQRETLRKAESELNDICTRAGVEAGDISVVLDRVNQISTWQPLIEKLRNVTSKLEDLSGDPEWLETPEEELRQRLQDSQEAAETCKALQNEIRDIELQMKQAMRGRDLHRLLEERETCARALEEDRSEALRTQLLRSVLDWLQESCRTGHQPEVLKTANRYLNQFTRHSLNLTLSLDKGVEAFMAGEAGHPPRALQQLSSGERTQLLMSVRLAFLQQQEQTALPLFVDEALGTSDDQRTNAILNTLTDIAKQGRQIFYFTAQTDELAKWVQVLDTKEVRYTVTDLAAVRANENAKDIDWAAHHPPSRTSFARKDGESDTDWLKRMNVPEWHPHQPVEDIHLWTLLATHEDALVSCLDRGISTWGQLETFCEAGAVATWLDEKALSTAKAKITALKALTHAWRIGRPTPVNPALLTVPDIVSETFQSGMLALLEEVDGSGPELIQALENKKLARWRQDKTSELEHILETHGHLTRQPPLLKEKVVAQAYAAVDPDTHALLSPQDWAELETWFPFGE